MTTACPCQVVLLFSSSPSWFPVFLARVLLSHIFTFLAFISFLLSVEPKLQAWSHGVALLIHCGGAGPARPCAVRSGCCERSESLRAVGCGLPRAQQPGPVGSWFSFCREAWCFCYIQGPQNCNYFFEVILWLLKFSETILN